MIDTSNPPNHFIRDKNLSLKSKALLELILTFPDGYSIIVSDIIKYSSDGIDAHASAMLELEEYGYISKQRTRNAQGHFTGWEYNVNDKGLLRTHIQINSIKREKRSGYIYLMEFDGYYKIGKTKNIKKRSKTIKMLLPKKSKLLAYVLVDDYSEVEKAMHSKFDHLRLNGEWFDLGEDAETLFTNAINELK